MTQELFPAVCGVCGTEVMVEQETIDAGLIMCSEECLMTVLAVDDAEDPEFSDEEMEELDRQKKEDLEATRMTLLRLQDQVRREDGLVTLPEEAWDQLFAFMQTLLSMAGGDEED